MNAALKSTPQVDEQSCAVGLLDMAIARVRPLLMDATRPTKERIRILWATAKRARDLGTSDVVHDAFMALAVEVNLIDQKGRWTGNATQKLARLVRRIRACDQLGDEGLESI